MIGIPNRYKQKYQKLDEKISQREKEVVFVIFW